MDNPETLINKGLQGDKLVEINLKLDGTPLVIHSLLTGHWYDQLEICG